jgi:cytochrome c6
MKRLLLLAAVCAVVGSVSARAADAKENWDKTCAKCHGPDGKGETKMGKKLDIKNLTDAKVQSSMTDEQVFKVIKQGVKEGDKTKMKPAEGLSDADIKALVAQVRSFKK